MVRRAEILAAVIDLEPVGGGPRPAPAHPGFGPRQVTVGLAGLLAVVLVGGALAGHRAPDRPAHRLHFDEPPGAWAPFEAPADLNAGAGESAAALGGAAPVRAPHHIPDG